MAAQSGDEGYRLAADLVRHYLSAEGGVIWVSPDRFHPNMLDYIGNDVAAQIPAESIHAKLLPKHDLFRCYDAIYRFPMDFKVQGIWNDDTLLASDTPWGYHSVIGRATYRSNIESRVRASSTANLISAVVETTVEIYDHYDWCFGTSCPATGVQGTKPPGTFYVGEAFALEEQGWAAQFGWYSAWNVYTKFVFDRETLVSLSSGQYIGWAEAYNFSDFEQIGDQYHAQFGGIGHQEVCDDWDGSTTCT